MKVQEATAAWLSNYEVLNHLTKQKERREKLNSELKHPPRTAGNIMTIEYEALSYLNGTPSKHLSEERLKELMEYLLQFSLTKAEKLQIINLLPKSPVELYLIVEECDERFTTDQIEGIIENIQRIASIPTTSEEISIDQQ